jgi:hypothetical protein
MRVKMCDVFVGGGDPETMFGVLTKVSAGLREAPTRQNVELRLTDRSNPALI